MNSIFDKFRPQPAGKPNVLNLIKEYCNIQQNPSRIADILLNSGKITQEQYSHIKGLSSPKDIGEYLLGNNSDFQKLYNGNR